MLLLIGIRLCCGCRWTCGGHLDVGTHIWWNLCLLGNSAAVGIDMHWACHLLGMHASQSPHPELLMSLSRPASLNSSLWWPEWK